MVTGEWLARWTAGVIFLRFSVEQGQAQSERRVRDTRNGKVQNFFPRLSLRCMSRVLRFRASFAQKGEQIAPVLRASEWYPFFTYSEESLCIKVDPECCVLMCFYVDKKAGTFTFHYFRWKGFCRETTTGNTSAHAAGPYVCVCEIVENGEKCQFSKIPGYVWTRPGISIPIKARYPVVWRWTALWQICWEFRKIYSYTDLAWQAKSLYWCLVLMCLATWALFVDI